MVKTLTQEGAKFQWMSNKDWETIFKKLFHVENDSDEYGPLWYPNDYDDDHIMSMRDIRMYRAMKCHKEKQKMLSAVIAAGMPRGPLIPSIDVDGIKESAAKLAKDKGLDKPNKEVWKEINKGFDEGEKRSMQVMKEACISYNSTQKRGKEMNIFEYAHRIDNLFMNKSEESIGSAENEQHCWWDEPKGDDYDYGFQHCFDEDYCWLYLDKDDQSEENDDEYESEEEWCSSSDDGRLSYGSY